MFNVEAIMCNFTYIDISSLVFFATLFCLSSGKIVQNLEFGGLSAVESKQLQSYQLLRNPELPSTLMSIRKIGGSNSSNFLDDISSHYLQTKGADAAAAASKVSPWSLQSNDSGSMIILRSLKWPGFEAQVEVGSASSVGQSAYYGSGLENQDILWML